MNLHLLGTNHYLLPLKNKHVTDIRNSFNGKCFHLVKLAVLISSLMYNTSNKNYTDQETKYGLVSRPST